MFKSINFVLQMVKVRLIVFLICEVGEWNVEINVNAIRMNTEQNI